MIRTSDIPIIPKKIHYMWLGKDRIPENLQWCINSWRRYCPEYEIIRWDESNYDIGKCSHTRKRLLTKQTVKILEQLNVRVHINSSMMIQNIQSRIIRGCSGAVQGSPSLKAYLSAWEQRNLVREDGSLDDEHHDSSLRNRTYLSSRTNDQTVL